jgi:hypothetical protein
MPKAWPKEQVEYLEDKWGTVSIAGIAKHLGRTINAVKLRANRLGLSDPRMMFDGITVNQLSLALNKSYSSVKGWIKTYGMPARKKVFCKESRVYVIGYNEFWGWAEKHKEVINLAKMEPNTLGPEPDWAKEKRKADQLRSQKTWQSVTWTTAEDQQLNQLVRLSGITYPMLALQFNRSEASVKRRLYDLGIKFRPDRLNNLIKYTPEEVVRLSKMACQGHAYETIAQVLGKSALGVRGKLERMGFDFKRREFREGAG